MGRKRASLIEVEAMAEAHRRAHHVGRVVENSEMRVICERCGCRGEEHAGSGNPLCVEGTCPSISSWGCMKPFPSFKHSGESIEADRKIDRELAKFWSSKSVFKPRI
jgi:hypothetical protein